MEKITINGVEYKLTPIENESPNSFEPKFKVGDVIFAKSKFNGDSFIRIFLKLDENKSWAYCNICSNGYFDASKGFLLLSRYDFYPATKEQRNLLFTKMKEAGYEWDSEKKELKKIDARENLTLDGDLMEADCMIVEQKSWSEEDEMNISQAIYVCHQHGYTGVENWLKAIKQRIGG